MGLMDATWLIVLLGFALGVLTGAVVYRLTRSDSAKANKLEQELIQLQHQHESYKKEVSNHFSKTSELVEDLTSDYVRVYKHLASGATNLANIPPSELLINQQQENSLATIVNEVEGAVEDQDSKPPVEPPKDYAPKEEGSEGTLSESFSVGTESKTKHV